MSKFKITFHTKMGMTALPPITFKGTLADAIKAGVAHVNKPPYTHDTYLIGFEGEKHSYTTSADGRVISKH
jgi:hypothetical protein